MERIDLEAIQQRWINDVWKKAKHVDPNKFYVWEGLLLGFLLGAHVPLKEAKEVVAGAPANGWRL